MAPTYLIRLIVSFALCLSASEQTVSMLQGRPCGDLTAARA